jgi:hypothetical protein
MLGRPLFWTQEYADLHNSNHNVLEIGPSVIAVDGVGGTTIKSPGRATFGGIWSDSPLTQKEFLQTINELGGLFPNSRELQMNLPPEYFYPEIFEPQEFFISQINTDSYFEFNYHINVNSAINLSKGNRKKQRQFVESGGIVDRANQGSWKVIYELLSENRLRRGANMSMPWETFERSLLALPNSFQLFQANIDERIIGAALTVKIDKKILYVLFWGDSLEGREISVVASISKHLVEYCKKNSINILDLGISSVNGKLDDNLARFKRNLGAIETKKPIHLVPLK